MRQMDVIIGVDVSSERVVVGFAGHVEAMELVEHGDHGVLDWQGLVQARHVGKDGVVVYGDETPSAGHHGVPSFGDFVGGGCSIDIVEFEEFNFRHWEDGSLAYVFLRSK